MKFYLLGEEVDTNMSPAITLHSYAKTTLLALCLVCDAAVDAFGKALPCKYFCLSVPTDYVVSLHLPFVHET